jgi:DNA-binding NarL/FixJ family response regulator
MAHSLTRRELEILTLIARAKSNKDIADELFISDQTVSVHRKNLMRKLKVSNSAGLLKFFLEHELFSTE